MLLGSPCQQPSSMPSAVFSALLHRGLAFFIFSSTGFYEALGPGLQPRHASLMPHNALSPLYLCPRPYQMCSMTGLASCRSAGRPATVIRSSLVTDSIPWKHLTSPCRRHYLHAPSFLVLLRFLFDSYP